jgi:hypothetical protein
LVSPETNHELTRTDRYFSFFARPSMPLIEKLKRATNDPKIEINLIGKYIYSYDFYCRPSFEILKYAGTVECLDMRHNGGYFDYLEIRVSKQILINVNQLSKKYLVDRLIKIENIKIHIQSANQYEQHNFYMTEISRILETSDEVYILFTSGRVQFTSLAIKSIEDVQSLLKHAPVFQKILRKVAQLSINEIEDLRTARSAAWVEILEDYANPRYLYLSVAVPLNLSKFKNLTSLYLRGDTAIKSVLPQLSRPISHLFVKGTDNFKVEEYPRILKYVKHIVYNGRSLNLTEIKQKLTKEVFGNSPNTLTFILETEISGEISYRCSSCEFHTTEKTIALNGQNIQIVASDGLTIVIRGSFVVADFYVLRPVVTKGLHSLSEVLTIVAESVVIKDQSDGLFKWPENVDELLIQVRESFIECSRYWGGECKQIDPRRIKILKGK